MLSSIFHSLSNTFFEPAVMSLPHFLRTAPKLSCVGPVVLGSEMASPRQIKQMWTDTLFLFFFGYLSRARVPSGCSRAGAAGARERGSVYCVCTILKVSAAHLLTKSVCCCRGARVRSRGPRLRHRETLLQKMPRHSMMEQLLSTFA